MYHCIVTKVLRVSEFEYVHNKSVGGREDFTPNAHRGYFLYILILYRGSVVIVHGNQIMTGKGCKGVDSF